MENKVNQKVKLPKSVCEELDRLLSEDYTQSQLERMIEKKRWGDGSPLNNIKPELLTEALICGYVSNAFIGMDELTTAQQVLVKMIELAHKNDHDMYDEGKEDANYQLVQKIASKARKALAEAGLDIEFQGMNDRVNIIDFRGKYELLDNADAGPFRKKSSGLSL
jgi:hypothetical protein